MRKFIVVITVIVLAAAFAGCSDEPLITVPGQVIKEISAAEAYAMVQQNAGKADFIILDVRTPAEFAAGHLAGAILIDFNAGSFRTEVENLDKSKRYLVYCRTSNRSGQAVAVMKELGFKEVYDMDGGIVAWEAAGYPTVQ
ncbi:rhodanese-like domain-containing protein [Dehalogenimonas sp. 4OHTPN]|uniref:Rhodanese-like domain-containing protein n=1 Tax=Dehalogenimonas sp. 4OHTPN TaxID=3166643 RepID=A0AAU8G6P5_9CHLR